MVNSQVPRKGVLVFTSRFSTLLLNTTCPRDQLPLLAKYYQATGDWFKALGYYNVGPTGYKRSLYMRNQAHRYANSVKRHEQALKEAL
jgi:hypothetical protein